MITFYRLCITALAAAMLAGCSPYYGLYGRQADREVERLRSEAFQKTLASRSERALRPDPAEPAEPAEPPVYPPIDLHDALSIAVEHSREYKTQREGLYLTGLDLTQQINNFSPRLRSVLRTALIDGPTHVGNLQQSATLGMTWITPTGGTFGVSGTAQSTRLRETLTGEELSGPRRPSAAWNMNANFRLPLLAGAGYVATHEPLTQAQRNLVDSLRQFERFRERFTIDIVSAYYDLVVAKRRVENAEANLERFEFLRRRSDALFGAGKATALDVFRSRQEELTAENNLIRERQTVANALDRFKLTLGLPAETDLDIVVIEPEFRPVDYSPESAIEAALANRLDLHVAIDEVTDAERRARIARRTILPDLALEVDYDMASLPGTQLGHLYNDEGRTRVGAALELPLDKTSERNAWRRAQVTLDRARRRLEEQRDEVRNEVLRLIRQLNTAENSVVIQQQSREIAKQRLENARILFEIGAGSTRDVVEAQQALLNAQNAIVRALADYEVARLQLLRAVGIFFVGPGGQWDEFIDVAPLPGIEENT